MLTLQVSDITVLPHRQRRSFDEEKLRNLAESIEQHQLFNALVVRPPREGENVLTPWVLVQGERRLRAIKEYLWGLGGALRHGSADYPVGSVPAVTLGELDPLSAEEAELEENLNREDLTLQERIAAVGRLAALRERQALAAGKAPPTVADIAREVRDIPASVPAGKMGDAQANTRKEIILSRHLDKPEVAKAKSLDEAWKALKRGEENQRMAALAERVGRTFSADIHSIIHADCIEWMPRQEGGQFDVIITDPPYGIDAQQFGDGGGRLVSQVHHYDDSYATWVHLMGICVQEWYRLAKEQAHAYICCDIDNFLELRKMMSEAGWWVHRTPIINHKPDGSRVPWPEHGPQRKWEMVLYAVKGKRVVKGIFPDLVSSRGDENLGHGAQKPVAFFVDLLRRSVNPGDSVLDTFAGTGTTVLAAHVMKCRAVCVEKEAIPYGIAVERVEELRNE